jgi:hypothetical protein
MIAAAFALILAPAAAPPGLTGELLAVERSFYEGWKAKSVAPFEAGLGEGAIAFGSFGAIDRKAQIDGQVRANAACTVNAFSLEAPASVPVSPDAAVLYYRLVQDADCGGAKAPSPSFNTSVYARRGGRWVNVFRTFAPGEGAGSGK